MSSSGSHSLERRRLRLSGEFDIASAHRALELLSEHSLYGSIVISDGLTDLCFFFTRGGLRVIAAGRELPGLRFRLLHAGVLGEEELRNVERRLRAGKSKGKEALAERELLVQAGVDLGAIDEAARAVIADAFLGSLFWEKPNYEATTGEPDMEVMQRRDLSAVTLSLGVAELVGQLQQKLRTVSEIRRTVSSLDVTLEPTGKGRQTIESRTKLGDGPTGQQLTRVLALIVSQPGEDAPSLAEKLKIGDLELASVLQELSVGGYVRLERKAANKAEELERVRKVEEGIDQALSQLLRRMRAAQDSAQAGDGTRAARHMARAGGLLMQEGRDDEAVRSFKQALQHSDEDLEAREGYVQSLWRTGRTDEALDQSTDLGKRYLELNLPQRAKRILERALGREERTDTLQVLVSSLVKLKQPRAAAEAGERLVNRLRREGRSDEARSAAGRLLAIADDRDRQRLLKAAGANNARLVVLLVTLLALAGLYLPVVQAQSARARFELAARGARDSVRLECQDMESTRQVLDRLRTDFGQLADAGGATGERAGEYLEQVEGLRAAHDVYRQRLARFLPWRETEDLYSFHEVLEDLAENDGWGHPALAQPGAKLYERVDEWLAQGARDVRRLNSHPAGSEARALAAELLGRYGNAPRLLEPARLRVELVSRPPGASVTWDGVSYSKQTPVDLALPLRERVTVVLEREGFEALERVVAFEDVDEQGRVALELVPAQLPQIEPPDPDPDPDPGPLIEPVNRPEPKPTRTPSPAQSLRIRVVDGGFPAGKREASLNFQRTKADRFEDLRLSPTFKAVVQYVSEQRKGDVYLVGIRVQLSRKVPGGWRLQQSVDYELGDAYRRPVFLDNQRRRVVRKIEGTVGLPAAKLAEEVQAALDYAVQDYRRRGGT